MYASEDDDVSIKRTDLYKTQMQKTRGALRKHNSKNKPKSFTLSGSQTSKHIAKYTADYLAENNINIIEDEAEEPGDNK